MLPRKYLLSALLILAALHPLPVSADPGRDLNGQWYGAFWLATNEFSSGVLEVVFDEASGTAQVYLPVLGFFGSTIPLQVAGDQVTLGPSGGLFFEGTLQDGFLDGYGWDGQELLATIYLQPVREESPLPGPAPGPPCLDLPPLRCAGSVAYCSEIIPMEPEEGYGYFNYPHPPETWGDQRYSYVRRDLALLIKHVAAKVACKTAGWDYGNFAPLGLGDGSEADGSTPGTDVGTPWHPAGSHLDGRDLDTAYFQLYCPDNLLRPVGRHHQGGADQFHLVEAPYELDPWRTALFIAYLHEHPGLRVVGVDGQIGLVLEHALDDLVAQGWIDAGLRASIELGYEVEDTGLGWYLSHHHHMHISMLPEVSPVQEPILPVAGDLNLHCQPNPFNPMTAITFTLDQPLPVRLAVHDLSGQRVCEILSLRVYRAGRHEAVWEGRDDSGRPLPSGVYFLRLAAGTRVVSEKVTLLK